MPSTGPDDFGDNNEPESNPQKRDVWLITQNLSVGDLIKVNGEIVLEVVQDNQTDYTIECIGEFQPGNDTSRYLRLEITNSDAITLYHPEMKHRIEVTNISAVGGTILSVAAANSLLPRDVTGEQAVDPYTNERDPGVEFSDDVSFLGVCPCGGNIAAVGPKALCETCGRWVPIEIWNEWSSTSSNEITESDADTSDSSSHGNQSANRSLDDFK